MSLYRQENLRAASIAMLGGALLLGAIVGNALEGALCTWAPSYAKISLVIAAAIATFADLVYRYAFREAAERQGWRRFVNPASGAKLFIVPLWLAAAPVLVVALVWGVTLGFCG
jgi:hypothetical protein